MAADHFNQLLNSLLSTDNDVRQQAEVKKNERKKETSEKRNNFYWLTNYEQMPKISLKV